MYPKNQVNPTYSNRWFRKICTMNVLKGSEGIKEMAEQKLVLTWLNGQHLQAAAKVEVLDCPVPYA